MMKNLADGREEHINHAILISLVFDGEENRMLEMQDEGFMPGYEEKTVFIANYYEETIRGTSDSIQSVPDSPYKMYFPFVGGPDQLYSKSYYYADGERFAMRHGQSYYYVFGDHLGSTTTVVERETGRTISRQLYHPWGTTRYSYNSSGEQSTDYGYTGQMKVDDIYYYNARWYDPMIGRFMQADTIVPPHQGTQGFDRCAYINNNPVNGTDPTGHWYRDTNLMMTDSGGGLKIKKQPLATSFSGHCFEIYSEFNQAFVTDGPSTPQLEDNVFDPSVDTTHLFHFFGTTLDLFNYYAQMFRPVIKQTDDKNNLFISTGFYLSPDEFTLKHFSIRQEIAHPNYVSFNKINLITMVGDKKTYDISLLPTLMSSNKPISSSLQGSFSYTVDISSQDYVFIEFRILCGICYMGNPMFTTFRIDIIK